MIHFIPTDSRIAKRFRRYLLLYYLMIGSSIFAGCADENVDSVDTHDGVSDMTDHEFEEVFGDARSTAIPDGWNEFVTERSEPITTLGDAERILVSLIPGFKADRLLEGFFTQERITEYEAVYASCVYATDDTGLLRVNCDTSLKGWRSACPQVQWTPFSSSQIPSLQNPGWYYCADQTLPESLTFGDAVCDAGYVQAGSLQWDAGSPRLSDTDCIKAETCAKIRDHDGLSGRIDACYYTDLTVSTTGEIATVDCSTLADGECASNCDCPNALLPGFKCYGVSEEHPIGICRYDHCVDDRFCVDVGEKDEVYTCVTPTASPEWWQKLEDVTESSPLGAFYVGGCVKPDVCEDWSARYPGVWSCSTSPD